MKAPGRLQLSRKRGFSLKEASHRFNGRDVAVVARPGKWGNPFSLEQYEREDALKRYRQYISGKLMSGALDISELRGKNLACWCAAGLACHADILLELANP